MTEPTMPTEPVARRLLGDDSPWATFFHGIEVKVLQASLETNSYSLVTRFAPGTMLPRHKHFGTVHAYTLSGRWHYLEYDWEATAGSFVYEPAGSLHTLHVPEDATEPAVIFFMVVGGMAMINDLDEIWMLEDAQQMVDRYRMVLESEGIEVPAIL